MYLASLSASECTLWVTECDLLANVPVEKQMSGLQVTAKYILEPTVLLKDV